MESFNKIKRFFENKTESAPSNRMPINEYDANGSYFHNSTANPKGVREERAQEWKRPAPTIPRGQNGYIQKVAPHQMRQPTYYHVNQPGTAAMHSHAISQARPSSLSNRMPINEYDANRSYFHNLTANPKGVREERAQEWKRPAPTIPRGQNGYMQKVAPHQMRQPTYYHVNQPGPAAMHSHAISQARPSSPTNKMPINEYDANRSYFHNSTANPKGVREEQAQAWKRPAPTIPRGQNGYIQKVDPHQMRQPTYYHVNQPGPAAMHSHANPQARPAPTNTREWHSWRPNTPTYSNWATGVSARAIPWTAVRGVSPKRGATYSARQHVGRRDRWVEPYKPILATESSTSAASTNKNTNVNMFRKDPRAIIKSATNVQYTDRRNLMDTPLSNPEILSAIKILEPEKLHEQDAAMPKQNSQRTSNHYTPYDANSATRLHKLTEAIENSKRSHNLPQYQFPEIYRPQGRPTVHTFNTGTKKFSSCSNVCDSSGWAILPEKLIGSSLDLDNLYRSIKNIVANEVRKKNNSDAVCEGSIVHENRNQSRSRSGIDCTQPGNIGEMSNDTMGNVTFVRTDTYQKFDGDAHQGPVNTSEVFTINSNYRFDPTKQHSNYPTHQDHQLSPLSNDVQSTKQHPEMYLNQTTYDPKQERSYANDNDAQSMKQHPIHTTYDPNQERSHYDRITMMQHTNGNPQYDVYYRKCSFSSSAQTRQAEAIQEELRKDDEANICNEVSDTNNTVIEANLNSGMGNMQPVSESIKKNQQHSANVREQNETNRNQNSSPNTTSDVKQLTMQTPAIDSGMCVPKAIEAKQSNTNMQKLEIIKAEYDEAVIKSDRCYFFDNFFEQNDRLAEMSTRIDRILVSGDEEKAMKKSLLKNIQALEKILDEKYETLT